PNMSTFFNQAAPAATSAPLGVTNAKSVVAHPATGAAEAGHSPSTSAGHPAAHPTSAANAASPPPAAGTQGAAVVVNVTAVGDSVMLGAVTDMEQAVPNLNVDAIEGRQASDAFSYIDGLLNAGTLGQEVILQVGTNGTIDPGALNALLDRLAGRKVILLSVHVPRPWQDPDNATIAAAAKAHPFVDLIDWNSAASAHPEWFWSDGIHLRAAGAQAYTALVAAALK
ncbi:MAG: hypothetical protein ACRDJU_12750, partial [Actinomycetota bacterium]